MAQPRLIVRIQRHNERPVAPQVDRHAGRGFELGGEIRPQPLADAAERDEIFFARLGLGANRQHAGRRMARAGTGRAFVEHRDGGAALGKPPRDRKADDAGADHHDGGG